MDNAATVTKTGSGSPETPSPLSPFQGVTRPVVKTYADGQNKYILGAERVKPTPTGAEAARLEDAKDVPTLREQRKMQRDDILWMLRETLGIVVRNVVTPQKHDGSFVPQYRALDGRLVAWSVWAPAKMLVIDRFRVELPSEDELARRRDHLAEHGIRYAVVAPGQRMSVRLIQNYMEELTNG